MNKPSPALGVTLSPRCRLYEHGHKSLKSSMRLPSKCLETEQISMLTVERWKSRFLTGMLGCLWLGLGALCAVLRMLARSTNGPVNEDSRSTGSGSVSIHLPAHESEARVQALIFSQSERQTAEAGRAMEQTHST